MQWFLAGVALWLAADSALPVDIEARAYRIDEATSSVTAQVPVLGFAGRTIRFPKMQGKVMVSTRDPEGVRLEINLDTRAVTASDRFTQAQVRGPMFFDAEHFPTLRFIGHRFRVQSALAGELDGEMTIRGVTKPATLHVTFAQAPLQQPVDTPLALTAVATINRRDFGMTAMPLLVGRRVAVTIQATLLPIS